MEEPAAFPEETHTHEPARPPWHRGLGPCLFGVAIGVLVIGLGALYETLAAVETPLDDAILVLYEEGDDPLPAGVGEAAAAGDALPVTLYQLPPGEHALPDDGPFATFAELMPRAWLVSAEGEAAEGVAALLAPLVVRGELPAPGASALLAGPGAGTESILLGGERLEVAGELGKNAGIFHGTYLMLAPLPPEAAEAARETRQGYIFLTPDAFREAVPTEERGIFTLSAGMHFAPAPTIGLAILGLLIVAVAGSLAWIRLMQNLAGRGGPFLRPAFDACRDESALLISTHAILYGIFFALMALGLVFTDAYVMLLAYVREIFASGPLQGIGEAYESGNILAAKFQTWRHNYLVATVLLSALPSLFIPGAALIKNLFSFALLGFVLVPVLADSAFLMSFHSITMWLELEAYILISFAAVVLPRKVLRALFEPNGDPLAAYADGAKVLGSMTLLVGALLLVAALYEATTLILLR